MSPSPRAVAGFVAAALLLLLVPWPLVVLVAVGWAAAVAVDAGAARRPVVVRREVPARVARGLPVSLRIEVEGAAGRAVTVRQPFPPDLDVVPGVGAMGLDARLVAHRRGRHELPAVAVRITGPLGLGRWDHHEVGPTAVQVLPDLPAARRLAVAVRQARFRDPGLTRRGALGLGTAFDRIREYQPDDDVRHVNWVATARQGRPMTNQFREETERDVLLMVDAGRLMAAPVASAGRATGLDACHGTGAEGEAGARTRLDAAVDAAVAVAAVADAVGDRCGVLAFDDEVRARVAPRRASGDAVVRALHDLEPRARDSDPERALRSMGLTKRSLLVLLTDVLDDAAAAALLSAVPVLTRRHAVLVASSAEPDLVELAAGDPGTDPRARVAREVLAGRDRVVAVLRHRGARVVEAPAHRLGSAVVAAYLEAKASARL